jgi:feruloyl-CoA synthase
MATNADRAGPLFARPAIAAADAPGPRRDGSLTLGSAVPLVEYPITVVHSLRAWAQEDPGRQLVAERGPDGSWRGRTYGEAVAAADAIGQALLDRGPGPGRPLRDGRRLGLL